MSNSLRIKTLLMTSSALVAAPAFAAPVTYDVGAGTIANNNNTTLSGTTATTNGLENQGARMTGVMPGGGATRTWNFTGGGLTVVAASTAGFLLDTSGSGDVVVAFTGIPIVGNDEAGIKITTSGTVSTTMNINNSAVAGGATGGTAAGIYIDSSSTHKTDLTVNSASSVTNGGGAAAIDVVRITSSSTISNSGTVSGGAGTGHGIYMHQNALSNISNNVGGSITGGDTGTSHGVLVESNSGSGAGVTTFTSSGAINGGTNAGDAVRVQSTGIIGTFTNNGGTLTGGGNSHGLSVHDTGVITTLTNSASGLIDGGTGNSHGIYLTDSGSITTLTNNAHIDGGTGTGHGILLDDTASMTTLDNRSGGIIDGGDTAGAAIYVRGDATISGITNRSGGIINNTGNNYGILVQGDAAGDLANIDNITNRMAGSTINGSTAAIALLGGDATQSVSVTSISNTSSGVIQGLSGGDGVQIGNYTNVNTFIQGNATISGNGGTGDGILIHGNATVTSLSNGFYTSDTSAKIAGSNSSTGGTGIRLEDSAFVTTLNNRGTISSRLNADSTGGDGINVNQGVLAILNNHGTIKGGTSTGRGIVKGTSGIISNINNYAGATISGGANAIELSNTGGTTTISTAGNITGNIQFGATVGTGDLITIFGGSITGNVLGVDNSGNYGRVIFATGPGGVFGTGGTSSGVAYSTSGDFGQTNNRLLSATVANGFVTLNDDIYATTTTIASGATLTLGSSGNSISGALVNSGTLALGTHYLNVNGALSGAGSITTTIAAGTGGSHGYLFNTGATSNISNMTIVPTYNGGDVVAGETLVLVYDPASITFSSVAMQTVNGMKWTLSEATGAGSDYQGFAYTTGSLLATAGLVTDGVHSTNASSVNALSNYSGSDTDIDALQTALNSNTNNNQAGAQLRPDANGGSIIAALNSSEQAQDSISSRVNGTGVSSGEQLRGAGAWAHGFGSTANQGHISGVNGFDMDTDGATFGADKTFANDAWRVGGAFTYANTEVDETGVRTGSGEDVDSYIGNIYGRYTGNSFYVDGVVTAGLHHVDARRLVNFVGNTLARGEFESQHYGAKTTVGMPLSVKRFTVTPSIGFAYDTLLQDGYTETGAGGANLVVDDSTVQSYRSIIGIKAATSYALDSGWQVRPAAHVGYKHEFNENIVPNQSVSMSAGGVSFVTTGLDLPQDSVLFGAEVEIASTKRLSLTARYDGEYREHYLSHAAHLRGRYEF